MAEYSYDHEDGEAYFSAKRDDYPACSKPSQRGLDGASKNLKNNQFYRDKFKVNEFGYRSDEFTDVHEKKHVLFAGCSVAYGDGMDLEGIWARKIYDKINEHEETSGYYNIGSNGASPMEIMNLIFQYINKFGMPDVIFVGFPEFYRDISEKDMTEKLAGIQAVWFDRMLKWLSGMCEARGAQLYMFRWNHNWGERGDVIHNYMTHKEYIHYDNLEAMHFAHQYSSDHEGEEWVLVGWDDGHPGKAFHQFWYEMLYREYARRNGIND